MAPATEVLLPLYGVTCARALEGASLMSVFLYVASFRPGTLLAEGGDTGIPPPPIPFTQKQPASGRLP